MELQSFYLKLNELKEYDQSKIDRQEGNLNKDEPQQQQPPAEKMITKGPKTQKEIHTRIGLNMNSTT
jgi:FtsZ-interacting cell division protein YlmF